MQVSVRARYHFQKWLRNAKLEIGRAYIATWRMHIRLRFHDTFVSKCRDILKDAKGYSGVRIQYSPDNNNFLGVKNCY